MSCALELVTWGRNLPCPWFSSNRSLIFKLDGRQFFYYLQKVEHFSNMIFSLPVYSLDQNKYCSSAAYNILKFNSTGCFAVLQHTKKEKFV